MDDDGRPGYTATELAAAFGYSRRYIYLLRQRGHLPPATGRGSGRRYPAAAYDFLAFWSRLKERRATLADADDRFWDRSDAP